MTLLNQPEADSPSTLESGRPEDAEILEALGRQDYHRGFELALERYQNKVFRLAYSMLHNESLAEDMAQDIFVRIWKALPGFKCQASLSTWIYTIARNACLTQMRKTYSRPTVSLDEPEVGDALERLPEMHSCDDAPGEEMDVNYLLARLPEHYRRVITLYYLEQNSYEEVAALLGIPLGTVKTYLHRAKKELLKIGARSEQAPCPA